MFRVQYDTAAPDAILNADLFEAPEDEEFVTFTKGGKFVAAVRSINILAIHAEKAGE